MARIVGHVKVTHGENQLNGPAADVNMKTGIAHIISDPGQRVSGLIMPNDTTSSGALGTAAKPATPPVATPKAPAP
jgi:lipopolysaccharide export system protein LptA